MAKEDSKGRVVAAVSGEVISLGTTQVVKVSGETVEIATPTTVKTGPTVAVTASSGGQALYSGAVKSLTLKSLTGNSGVIAVGGATDRPWYVALGSSQGLILDAGDAHSLDVHDFGDAYVVAQISGDYVSFDGVN